MSISESTVHQAIKPFLSPAQQGKVMAALRQIIDMHNPRAGQQITLCFDSPTPPHLMGMFSNMLKGAEPGEVIKISLSANEWHAVLAAMARDEEIAIALRRSGLQLINTAQGVFVKPIARQESSSRSEMNHAS